MNLNEISKTLNIPVSSVPNHINALSEAELVLITYQPSAKGHAKMCSAMVMSLEVKYDLIERQKQSEAYTVEMPVGMYAECDVCRNGLLLKTDCACLCATIIQVSSMQNIHLNLAKNV